MQKAAHYNASIEILTEILIGEPAEKALLAWSRRSRFAGSKDRAAIRDIVFDILRKRASYSVRFGLNARGLALAHAHQLDELDCFNGERFAPAKLSEDEKSKLDMEIRFATKAERYDFPEFLETDLTQQYGDLLPSLMNEMRMRAPVDLRVNLQKTTRSQAVDFLARDHIFTTALKHPTALRVIKNPRRISQSRAYDYGLVELQDVSSQIVSDFAEARPKMRVLDYCAGGGGKALAIAANMNGDGVLHAWDISQTRMKEIPKRAIRAGVKIDILRSTPKALYDLVFVDAPCSGSGAWRRSPDSKWRLTQDRLDALIQTQKDLLSKASENVRAGGYLIYATCSLLARENQQQTSAFLENFPNFECLEEAILTPLCQDGGDGFYAARLRKRLI